MSPKLNDSAEIASTSIQRCPQCLTPITWTAEGICSCHQSGVCPGSHPLDAQQTWTLPINHPFQTPAAGTAYGYALRCGVRLVAPPETPFSYEIEAMSHRDLAHTTAPHPRRLCPGKRIVELYSLNRYLDNPIPCSNGSPGLNYHSSSRSSNSSHHTSRTSFDSNKGDGGSSEKDIDRSWSSRSSERDADSLSMQQAVDGAGHWVAANDQADHAYRLDLDMSDDGL